MDQQSDNDGGPLDAEIPVHAGLYEAIQEWRGWLLAALQRQYLVEGSMKEHAIQATHAACGSEVAARVAAIEIGRFPKNPGRRDEACMYCPARAPCTGRLT
jgi:hypothetical protein